MLRSLSRMALVAAVASTTTWSFAQQPATSQIPTQSPTQQPTAPIQSAQGQNTPGQAGRPQGAAGQPGQAQAAGQMAQGVRLEAFIAHKLKRGNEAEVELGQLASERAKNESVKQFAQMMVQSHQKMIQQLEQFDQGVGQSGGVGNPNTTGQRNPGAAQPNATDREGTRRNQEANERPRSGDNTRNSESNTDGQNRDNARPAAPGSSQSSSASGTGTSNSTPNATNAQTPGVARPAGQVDPGQAPIGQLQGGLNTERAGGMSGHVPHMLVALTDQTCDNELQLTRQMLEKHEGSDFEMAYIGQQIVAHTCMLAHLQALKNSGPQELQQLVTQGEQVTRQHLEQAQKIAKSLASDESK